MPIALEPGGRYPVVLESDRKKPKKTQPTFYFRAMNGREWRKAAALMDGFDSKEALDAVDDLYAGVKVGLVGWSCMVGPQSKSAIKYNPDDLDLLINPVEGVELIKEMLSVGKTNSKN